MDLWRPDPTFYPSPKMAMQAPPEKLAFVAMINAEGNGRHDALGVVDVDPTSSGYGNLVGQVDMPNAGDELHHFGWNRCSACLCPYAPHPHMERRYLVVPGIQSSRIHVLDTKPDPRKPKIVKVIEPETVAQRAGYRSPHTVHCGPNGIFFSALGSPSGDGPGGIFVMDPDSFEILGRISCAAPKSALTFNVTQGGNLVPAQSLARSLDDQCRISISTALRSRAAKLCRDRAGWRPDENARRRDTPFGYLPSER